MPLIEPIEAAIRRLQHEIRDLEWAGRNAGPLRLRLTALLDARERGERWSVNF
jgi:hypothetical protein